MKIGKIMLLALALMAKSALAFPSWMGVYGNFKRHDDRANPGEFTILMNQDYYGLQAEVGVQVDNGPWVTYRMNYAGNVQGNSMWTFTPTTTFPGGSRVKYYFHGFDAWGGHIYDSRNGLNYEFVPSPGAEIIQRTGADLWTGLSQANGITMMLDVNLWVDFKIRNLGAPTSIGIVWTDDNWYTWQVQSAQFEGNLPDGSQQWGVDIMPTGGAYYHRSVGFIRWYTVNRPGYVDVSDTHKVYIQYALFYEVNGQWYWDNNGGQNYSHLFGY